MNFEKFSSLENTYNQKLIDKVVYEGLNSGTWLVTEKIHGANFSFWCDGADVKVASRTQFVDGTFFNCQAVINRYKNAVLGVHKNLRLTEGQVVVIYGELYGNGIQKEVSYGERDFRAFEVVSNGVILEKLHAYDVVTNSGIQFAPILFIGDYEKCLAYKEDFRSILTPEDHDGDNEAEGVVIEPVIPSWFNNGKRVYLKKKTVAFTEKKNKTHKQPSAVVEFSEEINELFSSILDYATEARVSNVISKIGIPSSKDFGRIVGLTIQDMLEEFKKDTEIDATEVAGEVWKDFRKKLTTSVSSVVQPVFLRMLE